MKSLKKCFSMILLISLIITMIPKGILAGVSETVTEASFVAMTTGQEIFHTVTEKKYYIFKPQESGWYRLLMEDKGKGRFTAGVYETIYYTMKNETKVEHTKEHTDYTEQGIALSDHVMWLNNEESYVFYCDPTVYEDPDAVNVAIIMEKVEVLEMEVVKAPTEPSLKAFIGTGMQVKIQYADSTEHYTLSDVRCRYNVNNDGTGYSYNSLCALEWSDVAQVEEAHINNMLEIRSIDDGGNIEVSELESGEHTITLGVSSRGNRVSYYEFDTTFQKQDNNIQSISVTKKKDSYTQWFGERLEDAVLEITYNDGTPSATIYASTNGGVGAYQYLSYETEGIDGIPFIGQTGDIDSYLNYGGTIGEAEVTVAYQGMTITYPITIEENPYNGIASVEPARIIYYANAGYKDEDCNFAGDSISQYNVGQITLTRKDGKDAEVFQNMLCVPSGGSYFRYGLELNDIWYKNIDAYIKAGGRIGEQELKVSYLDYEASCKIEIEDNPYVYIELVTEPTKKKYTYRYGSKINLSGLVFRAYKEDGSYDTYTYGEYGGNTAIEGWTRFLHCSLEDDSVGFLDIGEHTVYLTFMNMKMEYKIQIEEETEEIFTGFKIIKAPERVVYYTGENVNAWYTCPDADGMELEVTDSDGDTRKYRVGYNPGSLDEEGVSGEYALWNEVAGHIKFDWEQINWSLPGTYPVTVSCQNMTDTFELTIVDSPVTSFEIITMPKKMTYFRYEGNGMDLQGMSYKITFDDGTIMAGTWKEKNPKWSFRYKDVLYTVEKEWKKENSSGNPTYGENAIKFLLFGHEYLTDTIMVEEDPVDAITIIKNPEKTLYIGNDTQADLYGAKMQVTYKDGTADEVTVEEHTAKIELEKYKKELTAQVTWGWDSEYEINRKSIRISYMNKNTELFVEFEPSTKEAQVLTNGGQLEGLLNADSLYQIFSFTPEETGSYVFYCVDQDDNGMGAAAGNYFIEIYDEVSSINRTMYDGWNSPIRQEMQKGKTYYYVVSLKYTNYDRDRKFQCYLISENSMPTDLETAKVSEISSQKTVWYDFEMEHIRLGLSKTTYELTYENGWTEKKCIMLDMPSMLIKGKELSVEWKYTKTNEYGGMDPEIRIDNALIYTYDGKTVEVPVQLNVKSPVDSIIINNNPYEDKYFYEYQQGKCSVKGLSVTIQYNDGSEAQTVVWEDASMQQLGEYYVETFLDVVQTDETSSTIPYTLSVSYMGVSTQEQFEFLDSPVTAFKLKTKPQKAGFYSFEYVGTPDLYGMEFEVCYGDGTTETIKVSEHTNIIYTENEFGGNIAGYINTETQQDEEGNSRNIYVLSLNYLGYKQKIMEYENLPLPVEDATKIQTEDSGYILLEDTTPYKVFLVEAEGDNPYAFHAEGNLSYCTYLYNDDGICQQTVYGGSGKPCELNFHMTSGEINYIVIKKNETGNIGSILYSLQGEEIPKEAIETVELSIDNPVADNEFPIPEQLAISKYRVDSCQWYEDKNQDERADFATSHRLKLTLVPERGYCFTENTTISLNEKTVSTVTLGNDGKLSFYYTFPHTECKIEFSEMEEYILDTQGNEKKNRVTYGGTYKFRYLDEAGDSAENIIVKANGNVLPLDEDGYYTLTNVSENVTILAKSKDIQADETESLLTLHNGSEAVYDTMVGKKNYSIADNTKGENTLPLLSSYVNGSDQFFYGWYTEKDTDWNGINTRFTSRTKLVEDSYRLYAKWGSGLFQTVLNGKPINYQVLSFDEENQMTVQIKGIGLMRMFVARNQADVLIIPETIEQEQEAMQEELGIDIESCRVVALAENAFEGCTSLRQIVIPSTITELPAGVFKGCENLAVILPDTITTIHETAFAEAQNISIICSNQLSRSEVIQQIQNSNVTVKVVNLTVEDADDEVTFFYGDEAKRFSPLVKVNGQEEFQRNLIWQYPDTDAYDFVKEGNTLIVTPNRVTTEVEDISIMVMDEESLMTKIIKLNTVPENLERKDDNGKALYSIDIEGDYTYSGQAILPSFRIKKNSGDGDLLTESDYEITYADNIRAGTGKIIVTGKGNYTGSLTKNFTINKAVQTVTAFDFSKTTGNVSFPLEASTDGDGKLTYVSSNPNVATVDDYGIAKIHSAGVTTISIQASETVNYKASEIKNITLTVSPLSGSILNWEKSILYVPKNSYTKVYGSKPFELNVITDTEVIYMSDNKNVVTVDGTGKVTLKKCGKAIITVRTKDAVEKITVLVAPKRSKAKVSSKKAGELKVSWLRQKEASGYVVEYSTNKKFNKNVLKKMVNKNKTTDITIKKLTKGKKYYVRVTAYTKVDKKKVYGKASKVVAKKVR